MGFVTILLVIRNVEHFLNCITIMILNILSDYIFDLDHLDFELMITDMNRHFADFIISFNFLFLVF